MPLEETETVCEEFTENEAFAYEDNSQDDYIYASWENTLEYIKLNLGASINNIEFTDEKIIEILETQVLPEYSRYDSLQRYYQMYETDIETRFPVNIYEFKNFPYKILYIDQVINKPTVMDQSQFYSLQQTSGDITDMLLTANYYQMSNDYVAINTWKFLPPNRIEVISGSNNYGQSKDFIAKVNCVHKDPSTINPDIFHLFKDLALANILIFIGRIRTKFQSFNTPQTQLDLLAGDLLQEGNQLKQDILGKLEELTPDNYIYFLN